MDRAPLVERKRFQFQLSHLLAAPLLVSPFFLAVSVSQQVVQPPAANSLISLAAVLLLYVLLCCWLAIRHLSPTNDLRRFPFRGSMLLGGVAGALFAGQLYLGLIAVFLVLDTRSIFDFPFWIVIPNLVGAVFYGGFVGMFCGLVAGGLYCGLRFVGVSHSQVTPKGVKAWRRRGREC